MDSMGWDLLKVCFFGVVRPSGKDEQKKNSEMQVLSAKRLLTPGGRKLVYMRLDCKATVLGLAKSP